MSGTQTDLTGATPPAQGGAQPPPAGGATPPPAANWYDGKATAEEIGLWQNKGWTHTDPVQVALQATKAYNEAQRFVGADPTTLLRLPKDPVAPEWSGVWERLGVPKEPTGYDLSQVKRADGSAIDPAMDTALRNAAHAAHVSASAMSGFASEFVKFADSQRAAEQSEAAAKLETERGLLRQNWGTNFEVNRFVAAQGAKALGLDDETISALEKTAGYAKTMEALRRVGVLNKDDQYVASGGSGSGIMTREQAANRMTTLKQDPAWAAKLLAGDAQAVREFNNLSVVLAGSSGGR
jgi:hypothetical protein